MIPPEGRVMRGLAARPEATIAGREARDSEAMRSGDFPRFLHCKSLCRFGFGECRAAVRPAAAQDRAPPGHRLLQA